MVDLGQVRAEAPQRLGELRPLDARLGEFTVEQAKMARVPADPQTGWGDLDVIAEIGLLGGSGLYEWEGIEDALEVSVTTPFGEPSDAFVLVVNWLAEQGSQRADLRDILAALPDIGRALGRIVAGRGSPRDPSRPRARCARSRAVIRGSASRSRAGAPSWRGP